MIEIKRGNWSFREPGDDVPNGAVITGGNFSQRQPDTPILVGKVLTIRGGNFLNVRKDPNWTIEGGNWTQKSRCCHLHPRWNLSAEVDNCPHVVDVDTVTIDGQMVDTIYHRKDTQVV